LRKVGASATSSRSIAVHVVLYAAAQIAKWRGRVSRNVTSPRSEKFSVAGPSGREAAQAGAKNGLEVEVRQVAKAASKATATQLRLWRDSGARPCCASSSGSLLAARLAARDGPASRSASAIAVNQPVLARDERRVLSGSQLSLLIGLGVVSEYAPLHRHRYRQGLQRGRRRSRRSSTRSTRPVAAVMFAGITVCIDHLLGMFASV